MYLPYVENKSFDNKRASCLRTKKRDNLFPKVICNSILKILINVLRPFFHVELFIGLLELTLCLKQQNHLEIYTWLQRKCTFMLNILHIAINMQCIDIKKKNKY